MSLVDWAKGELDRLLVGQSEEDLESQKEINGDILQVVEVFANQGHSGFSASYSLGILKRLLNYKPITPLTGEDDEWVDVYDNGSLYQNKRCGEVFKNGKDNSSAYYLTGKVFSDDGGETWWTNRDSSIPITFPYVVPEKPEYIILNKEDKPND